jgi:hypothetical protein
MCIPSILVNVFYIEFQTYVLRIDLILNVVSLSLSLSPSLALEIVCQKKKCLLVCVLVWRAGVSCVHWLGDISVRRC